MTEYVALPIFSRPKHLRMYRAEDVFWMAANLTTKQLKEAIASGALSTKPEDTKYRDLWYKQHKHEMRRIRLMGNLKEDALVALRRLRNVMFTAVILQQEHPAHPQWLQDLVNEMHLALYFCTPRRKHQTPSTTLSYINKLPALLKSLEAENPDSFEYARILHAAYYESTPAV